MSSGRFRFSTVIGHAVGRRAIGFVEEMVEGGHAELDAKLIFDGLVGSRERDVRKKFDHWLAHGRNDKWFHGWPNDASCRECLCFKWDEKDGHHRFYGFLYHPQPKTKSSFQICVLAYHDHKTKQETDRKFLIRCMNLRSNLSVQAAISFVFHDEDAKDKGKIQ